jgi:glycosyltransferase involved in cell wall biosynthesis
MRRLKILTWHIHGSYLYYLSHVPFDFFVPVKPGRPLGYAGRTASYRWPENIIEVPADKVKALDFDAVLFQSHDNYQIDQYEILTEKQLQLPRIFLEHNPPRGSPVDTQHPVDDSNVLLVHVTHYNELAWEAGRTPTRVIEHGVVVPESARYQGELDRGLCIMNNIASRGRRMGYDILERAREEVPIDLIGMGWKEAGGLGEISHADIAPFSTRYRFHFSPVRHSSLALSLCEAMMTGQPIVGLGTTEIPSVVENGVSGFVDTRLAHVIAFMKLLLRDRKLAFELGQGARKVAMERFHIDRFKADWIDAFTHVTGSTIVNRRQARKIGFRVKGRIAMVSEHASPICALGGVDSGGQNVYVDQVSRHLARQGWEVDIFTRRESEDVPEIQRLENGVRVVNVKAGPECYVRKEDLLPHIPEFTESVIRFMRWQHGGYDLLHANFWMSGLVASEIKRRYMIPFITTFHALGRVRRQYQGSNDDFPDERFEAEDRVVTESDGLIAECPQDFEDLLTLYKADPSKMTVIPCGFDPLEVYPIDRKTARLHLGLDLDTPVVLHLGRMVPRKGVDLAIRGFARLVKNFGVPAQMLIVGGNSEEPDATKTPEIGRLFRIAFEEGVADRVIFTGRRPREELKYYYSAADAFVTTPWYEPFGITPLEAMACGVPVLATRVGGLKSSVIDGETGYLISPNDVDELGSKLALLLANSGLREQLSTNAYQHVQRLYRWETVATAISNLYDKVLGRSELLLNTELLKDEKSDSTQEGGLTWTH